MTSIVYTDEDYAQAFLALCPTGRIWNKELDSPLAQAVNALVPSYTRLSDRARNLIADAFVASTTELLPEWELSLGLPDPCLGEAPSLEARRQEAVARFVGLGGQSIRFFIDYAFSLGYTIQIQETSAFMADRNSAESQLWDEYGSFLWQVNASSNALSLFRSDVSASDEPLWHFSSTVLQCEFTRLKPAHTNVTFSFNLLPTSAGIGNFAIGDSSIG